mgnify:CR=1 FL=1
MGTKLKLKKGDTVRVLRGRDRGKQGAILWVLPDSGKVLVEGVNMVFKHTRPKRQGEKAQRITVASAVNTGSVMVVCPSCKKASRLGRQLMDGKLKRVCKKCKSILE